MSNMPDPSMRPFKDHPFKRKRSQGKPKDLTPLELAVLLWHRSKLEDRPCQPLGIPIWSPRLKIASDIECSTMQTGTNHPSSDGLLIFLPEPQWLIPKLETGSQNAELVPTSVNFCHEMANQISTVSIRPMIWVEKTAMYIENGENTRSSKSYQNDKVPH